MTSTTRLDWNLNWSARRLKSLAAGLSLILGLMLSGLEATAEPNFGRVVNDYCTLNERPDSMPYTGDCALCHSASGPNSGRTALFDSWRSGDLDAFCPTAANEAPTFIAGSDAMVSEDALLTLDVAAQDPDGDRLRLEAANLPTGADFRDLGGGRGQLVWMPSFEQAGNHPVRFIATDDGAPPASATLSLQITVGDVNRPPVLAPIASQILAVGEPLLLPLSATDPDGDTVAFGHGGLPSGATLQDAGDGSAVLSWTPSTGDVGSTTVLISVSDDSVPMANHSREVQIAVGASNLPPVLQPIGDRAASEGQPWEIGLAANDPNGDPLDFGCEGAPAGSQLASAGENRATLSGMGSAGNYTVVCTVSDSASPPASDFEEFTLTIGSGNRPPVIDPISMSEDAGTITVRLTARDPDGDAIVFDVMGAPASADFYEVGPGAAELVWTPGPDAPTRTTLTFTATDAGSPPETTSARFTIALAAPPGSDAQFVELERARWNPRRAILRVHGQAAPGAGWR